MKLVYSIITLAFAFVCVSAAAQKKDNKEIIRTHSSEPLSSDVGFRYPKFSQGIVHFKDGTMSSARFNYNLVLGEMQFLDAKGDTLSVANEQDIQYITVGSDSFHLKKGVYETAGDFGYVKLASKQILKIIDNEKIGAYGIPSSSASISSLSIVDNNNRVYKLSANENYVYAKEKTWFLVVKANGQVLPATKQNVLKAYSRSRDKIEDYIAVQEIDFKSESDLKKLLTYCATEPGKKKK
jgi:hypothetical protein